MKNLASLYDNLLILKLSLEKKLTLALSQSVSMGVKTRKLYLIITLKVQLSFTCSHQAWCHDLFLMLEASLKM